MALPAARAGPAARRIPQFGVIQIVLAKKDGYQSTPFNRSRTGLPTHDPKYLLELGRRRAIVPLDSGRCGPRHAGLWLVDESYSGPAGSLFPPLDSCRYRLPRAGADGRPPGLARPQSDAGVTVRYAAVAADRGAGQPLGDVCHDHSGGDAGL